MSATEDPPEDLTQHAAFRASAEAASGWNGSRALYVPEPRQATRCPERLRTRLLELRKAAVERLAWEKEQARPWVVSWVAADGAEFRRECRSRGDADGLVVDLMSRGFADVKMDGAKC